MYKRQVRESIEGVEFISVNTDAQALRKTSVNTVIQIGGDITKGLGAGANPQVGRDAALEDREALKEVLAGADMVFIAAGMGGGTGTGAAPIIAEVAKELNILTVAVVTKPFSFEGRKRLAFAEQGIEELSKHVDSLITIPNEKLLKVLGRGVTLLEAFASAKSLTGLSGIRHMKGKSQITWVHFACDQHEVVRANGCWTESLLLGPMVVNGLSPTERQALANIFGRRPHPIKS